MGETPPPSVPEWQSEDEDIVELCRPPPPYSSDPVGVVAITYTPSGPVAAYSEVPYSFCDEQDSLLST